LLTGCFLDIKRLVEIAGDNHELLPIRTLKITIDPKQREQLFEQFHKFAEKHDFRIEISDYGTNFESYLIWMLKDNIKINASHIVHDRDLVSVSFYDQSRANPTREETMEIINELSLDLKNVLNEIPNVIINEKLKRLRITMDENQKHKCFTELLARLREFADQHSLEFVTASYDSNVETFLVEMHGDEFQLTSRSILSGPSEMNVEFYVHYDDNRIPTSISKKTIDELFHDLKNLFSKIPNVMITEEK
jgi:hypothetical protein